MATLETLQDEVTLLKGAFQRQIDELTKQVYALREEVDGLEKENFKKDQEIAGFQAMFDNIFQAHSKPQSENKATIDKRVSTSPVAFYACFNQDVNYLGRNQNLAFDRLITDSHGRYTRSSGSYRIPVTGFYVITWVTPVVGNIPFELTVNGMQRGRTDPSNTGNGASQSTTGVAVLSLYENDVVSIRTNPGASPSGVLVNNQC